MTQPPLDLTVVIPAYNNAAYLTEAVESVRRQTRPPRRIVLVDDGSTDNTPEIAAALRADGAMPLDYVRQDNAGPAAAINRGAAMVDSELIAFHSADDIWVAEKIAWQLVELEGGADLVFGHLQNFISPELDAATATGLHCPPEPMPGASAGTLLTRLETFRKVGPLNERFQVGEFIDWFARASDLGLRVVTLPQVVSMRRLHGRNHSLTRKSQDVGYAHVLKAMLDRRRARSGQP
jgi:glycosyltransferase involved in cell wall biosynthesis